MLAELINGDFTASDVPVAGKLVKPGASHDLPFLLCILLIIIAFTMGAIIVQVLYNFYLNNLI